MTVPMERVENWILSLRGHRVILDADLAVLYGVTTGALNQPVKRNTERLPGDFMFRLTAEEGAYLKSQIVISNGWGSRRRSSRWPSQNKESRRSPVFSIVPALANRVLLQGLTLRHICYNSYNHINRGEAMIREATAMKVRQNLGELLNEVQYRRDSIVVTKGGKPVAALVDIDLFQKIRLLDREFDRLTAELAKTYEGIDRKTATKEIDEAVKAARRL